MGMNIYQIQGVLTRHLNPRRGCTIREITNYLLTFLENSSTEPRDVFVGDWQKQLASLLSYATTTGRGGTVPNINIRQEPARNIVDILPEHIKKYGGELGQAAHNMHLIADPLGIVEASFPRWVEKSQYGRIVYYRGDVYLTNTYLKNYLQCVAQIGVRGVVTFKVVHSLLAGCMEHHHDVVAPTNRLSLPSPIIRWTTPILIYRKILHEKIVRNAMLLYDSNIVSKVLS